MVGCRQNVAVMVAAKPVEAEVASRLAGANILIGTYELQALATKYVCNLELCMHPRDDTLTVLHVIPYFHI